jgi:hypothetical protein
MDFLPFLADGGNADDIVQDNVQVSRSGKGCFAFPSRFGFINVPRWFSGWLNDEDKSCVPYGASRPREHRVEHENSIQRSDSLRITVSEPGISIVVSALS